MHLGRKYGLRYLVSCRVSRVVSFVKAGEIAGSGKSIVLDQLGQNIRRYVLDMRVAPTESRDFLLCDIDSSYGESGFLEFKCQRDPDIAGSHYASRAVRARIR
jgi:hypothetical protein